MCGIVGAFSGTGSHEERLARLRDMTKALAHRGPDDEGYHCFGNFGVGMRRLSIIDLKHGHQPIFNESKSQCIVCNGEIYNFKALRTTLLSKGHSFSSHSDTETLIHLYEDMGPEFLAQVNGMFGLAILDMATHSLFLARDRLGVKPLYYFWDGRTFLFASEIKALLASGSVPREINDKALWDYLTFRYIPQPESIWKHIYKLPPGHCLTLSEASPFPVIKPYWKWPDDSMSSWKSESEWREEFRELFPASVARRLIADVPVGILLSGGLDSSAVVAAVAEVHNSRIDSFSVGFAEAPETNELDYARKMANHAGLNHHEILISDKDFLHFLPKMTFFSDEPLADPAGVPLYFVSRQAAQNVKVVLSGEGADEIFGGYDFDALCRRWRMNRKLNHCLPPWLIEAGIGLLDLIQEIPDSWKQKRRLTLAQSLQEFPIHMTNYFSSAEKKQLFLQQNPWPDSMEIVIDSYRRSGARHALNAVLFSYGQDWLVEDLLMKADKMTMANSLELRVPFLDYTLVEWAAKMPVSLKVGKAKGTGRLIGKRIVREWATEKLPADIIQRPKMGFPVPLARMLQGGLGKMARELLLDTATDLGKWFDSSLVTRYVERGLAKNAAVLDQQRLWIFLVLELWAKQWLHP